LFEGRGHGGHVLGQGVVDARAAQSLDALQRSAEHLADQAQAQLIDQAMANLHQQPLGQGTADEQQQQQAGEQHQRLAQVIQPLLQAAVDIADQADAARRTQGTAQHRQENAPARVNQQLLQ